MVPKRPISQSPQTYPTSPVEETSPSAAGGYDIDNPGAPTSGKNDDDEDPLKKQKVGFVSLPSPRILICSEGAKEGRPDRAICLHHMRTHRLSRVAKGTCTALTANQMLIVAGPPWSKNAVQCLWPQMG